MKKRNKKHRKDLQTPVISTNGLQIWSEQREEPDWDQYTQVLLRIAEKRLAEDPQA